MFCYEYKTQYYETDQMGIIHHSNYIRWFESARIAYLQAMGIDYREMEEQGVISPVLSVNCEYKSMVKFGDTVVIIPKIEKYNGIKLELTYEVFDKESGILRTKGSSSHCFLGKEQQILSLRKGYEEWHTKFLKEMKGENA